MRKSKLADAQIEANLHEAKAGVPVADSLRKHDISRTTFSLRKQKIGGAGVPVLQRLKAIEHKNAKLKRMYSDEALTLTVLKDEFTRIL